MLIRTADHFRFRQLRPHNMRFLRQGHVYILGVDCTDDEWHKIEVIPCELFSRHARWCSGLIDYDGWCPGVRVACFGEHCDFGDVPDFMQFRFSQGQWNSRYNVAKLIFGPSVPMQNAVFHELTHAFMDLAGEDFLCPRPLEEGYALIIDYWLGDSRDPRYANNVMRAGRGRHRSLTPEQTMTIWKAFTLDPRTYQSVAGSPDPQLYQSICLAGVWLVLWLQKMSETRPCCGHILSILRRRRIATPVEVYGLLQELTQMNSSEMEASYREFATTANPMDFIPRPAQLDQIRQDGGNGTR